MSADGTLAPTLANNKVRFGRRLCRVYALFRTLCPKTTLSFEQAWSLCRALSQGEEIALCTCSNCAGQFVYDRLSAAPSVCACCRVRGESEQVPA